MATYELDTERVLHEVASRCDELILTLMTGAGEGRPVPVESHVALTMVGQLSGILLAERMTPGELAAQKRMLAEAIAFHRNGGARS